MIVWLTGDAVHDSCVQKLLVQEQMVPGTQLGLTDAANKVGVPEHVVPCQVCRTPQVVLESVNGRVSALHCPPQRYVRLRNTKERQEHGKLHHLSRCQYRRTKKTQRALLSSKRSDATRITAIQQYRRCEGVAKAEHSKTEKSDEQRKSAASHAQRESETRLWWILDHNDVRFLLSSPRTTAGRNNDQ